MPSPDRGALSCGRRGLLSGLATSWMLVKIMVPSIAAVQLLRALGFLQWTAAAAAPLMKIFGLPGEASLALLTGALVNIYAAIAVAVNIAMTAKDMTVLAIMVLIAHNLIVETAVQSRAGTPAAVMLTVRISAAVAAGALFNLLLPETDSALSVAAAAAGSADILSIVAANLLSLGKIVAIVMTLMVFVQYLREYGLLDRLMDFLHHPMRLLGMDRRTSFVAAVGLVLGLAYGAGLIVDEAQQRGFKPREILATNIFLGTSHALIEDSLIFAAVGANLLWIVVGRLVFGSVFLRLAVPVASRFIGEGEEGEKD